MSSNYLRNNLKIIRKKKSFTQLKVSMDLFMSQETLSNYEVGRRLPSSDMLVRLADYYDTSIDYLLCRTEYDIPINNIKPNGISDDDFNLINDINKLSKEDKNNIKEFVKFLGSK